MVKLTINGKEIEVKEGTTVLRAAEQAGITIPTLCDHKDLTPYGGCRLCMVEVQGFRGPTASCTLPVNPGMVVTTESPVLDKSRRTILELILSNYYDAGYETSLGDTELGHWVSVYGIDAQKIMPLKPHYEVNSDANPFVWVDMNKCILCTRCIRACAEVQGRFVWSLAERGFNTRVVAGADTDMLDARCESCGACVAYCPTGALNNKMSIAAGIAEKKVTTTCTYCGVGCQFDLNVIDNHIVRVTSHPDAPVNNMHLCVKGRYGYDFVHHKDRLSQPQVRKYLLEGDGARPAGKDRGEWVTVDWDTALNITAKKLAGYRDTYGARSVGVLTSAKCLNEENYVMNKFARQVVGTNTIDHCARL